MTTTTAPRPSRMLQHCRSTWAVTVRYGKYLGAKKQDARERTLSTPNKRDRERASQTPPHPLTHCTQPTARPSRCAHLQYSTTGPISRPDRHATQDHGSCLIHYTDYSPFQGQMSNPRQRGRCNTTRINNHLHPFPITPPPGPSRAQMQV